MKYAQILNSLVANVIVLDDESLAPIFKEGFDDLVRVDELDIKPDIGWSYDGTNFLQPQEDI
jgi:hypothetical protein